MHSHANLPKFVQDWSEGSDEAYHKGDRERALKIQLKLVEWVTTHLPELHPERALGLRKLAWLLHELGRQKQAYVEINETIRLYRGIAESSDPAKSDLADSLSNLASILKALGMSNERLRAQAEAAKIYQELARTYSDKVAGTTYRRGLAKALNSLGQTYAEIGQSDNAVVATTAAVRIYQELLRNKQDFPAKELADALNNLGIRYASRGMRQQAIEPAKQACSIYRALPAVNSAHRHDLAECLSNLGLHYRHVGNYDMALATSQEAVQIFRVLVQINAGISSDLALALDNLAGLYARKDNDREALALTSEALSLYDKMAESGQNISGRKALALSNLANHLARLGRFNEALPPANQAIQLYRDLAKAEKGYLYELARVLNNAGTYYDRIGKGDVSISFTEEALRIYSGLAAGPIDPVAISRASGNLALRYLRVGKVAEALPGLKTTVIADILNLQSQLPLVAEVNRTALTQQIGDRWEYSFYTANHGLAGATLALFTRLNRQGLLQDIQRNQLLLARTGTHRPIYEQLKLLTTQLTNASVAMEKRQQLLQEKTRLEENLFRLLPQLRPRIVEVQEIQRVLPDRSVLVEFQRFRPYQADTARLVRERYVALLLRADGAIHSVDLGEASTIDAAVARAVDLSAQQLQPEEVAEAWVKVSELVLSPLKDELRSGKELFLSPDGELNRVPFAAMPVPGGGGRLLPEVVRLRILTTGRDLLRLQQAARPGGPSAVVAAPAYGSATAASTLASARSRGSRRRSASNPSEAIPWTPLPETLLEASELAPLLNVAAPLTGARATVTTLRQLKAPRILHIATHGFFWPDPASPATRAGDLAADDPLVRSGLVMADANTPNAEEDGLLTAAEVIGMDLDGTELVTLSACESGLGDVRSGEGVYGMQRALMAAGSRSTLLSLWKVGDQPTRAFMTAFYRRLRSGEGRADALAHTQAEFRNHPTNPLYRHVYVWGAFQLSGDWRPITGL
ncbi:CHAT domain-containing tetratricopeptide repeat protein [Cyanobium sp. FGCU-52]|nr:CHAT domain-containing tetratricopeptide repeat protein [Cyanobium sp. FGCU52]